MPDKKLTDNEIIKALECCYTLGVPCENCPLCDVEECNDTLMAEYVKDLINRLQAENEGLQLLFESVINSRDGYIKVIEQYKAENERLSLLAELGNMRANDYRAMRDKLKNANADIDFLKNELSNCEFLKKELEIDMRTAKAEAYKECIEKVKSIVREMVDIMFDDNESKCRIDNCRYTSNVACGNEVCLTENRAFWNSKLENLLNELVGEDNESKNK